MVNNWILDAQGRMAFFPLKSIPLFGKKNNHWIREDNIYWECRRATMLEF